MEQLNTANPISLTDMKQELGRAVAILDKANSASPVKDFRYVMDKGLFFSSTFPLASSYLVRTVRGYHEQN